MVNEPAFYDLLLSIKGDRNLFVETGTAVGSTSEWASKNFEKVITIEYMDDLYRSCIEKFWNINNIKLIHGDSSKWIDLIVHNVTEDAVWFLDAHNVNREDGIIPPQETPIIDEIIGIFKSVYSHLVIVDDLRLFGSEYGYPHLEEIINLGSQYLFDIEIIEEKDVFIARRV
jgi:hypothetical protein